MVVRCRGMRSACSLILFSICACGGGKPATILAGPAPGPAVHGDHPDVTPVKPTAPDAATPFVVDDAHAPEFFPPPWRKVSVGQTISFSTAAIDQDLDETRVEATKLPATAKLDAITQTITWTPTKADLPKGEFTLTVSQPGRGKQEIKTFSIEVVTGAPQPAPVAPPQTGVIETLLLIREPKRLEQVNKDWPIDKLLQVGAETFKLQIPEDKRKTLAQPLDGKAAFDQMLVGLAQTHSNPRLDPASPQFDKAAFGDPKSWKIVAFRPRIDKAWTELRVVYRAMNAAEPTFAMFRLRPVVEYVPALPRPDEERDANNKLFLGMVAKHLMKDGGSNPKFIKDEAAHGKEVSALMTELMTFDDTRTKPYLHGFEIGIALEARMGGGSARNPDGSYKSGDGWGWNAMKPFQTADGKAQAYVNVNIPGFWTQTVPSKDGKTWTPKCSPRFHPDDPAHVPGYEVLCRKPLGFVDLPAMKDGKVTNGKVDANNLYFEHKKRWMVEGFPLEDGRRDLGEENGMTCAQCHIRNFGMHDYGDPANVDPSKGTPKQVNHALQTLNFQIIPSGNWEAFTLEFLQHQECRGKLMFEQFVGPDAAKGLTCPLAK
ncbi:MAG: hypothetical protein JWO36_3980 [Myxococcales bacterium]|nr:hypothetical protein [Myxococcales bacterium]